MVRLFDSFHLPPVKQLLTVGVACLQGKSDAKPRADKMLFENTDT